jgi:hypothetical protein
MIAKSFLDNSSDVVVRALRGTVRFSPDLALDPTDKSRYILPAFMITYLHHQLSLGKACTRPAPRRR